MKVIRGFSTDPLRPATQPFPDRNGIFIEFRGGDVCDPLMIAGFGGNWFHAPWPKYVLRYWVGLCEFPVWALLLTFAVLMLSNWFLLLAPLLPNYFISYRFGNRAGYAGWKIYGVDAPEYKNFLNPADVYAGSQALHLSIRPFASLK